MRAVRPRALYSPTRRHGPLLNHPPRPTQGGATHNLRRTVITGTVTSRRRTEEIEITLTDAATITVDAVFEAETARVTELHIRYEGCEVTRIAYKVIGDDDYDSVSVHPDYLDRPQEWPNWVRCLVEEHRPVA